MSEDVDFKIVPRAAAPASRRPSPTARSAAQANVGCAAGSRFVFDSADKSIAWARDEGRYAFWQLPYPNEGGAGERLRPAIKVELNDAPLRRPRVMLP
jgi:hypothetical protein